MLGRWSYDADGFLCPLPHPILRNQRDRPTLRASACAQFLYEIDEPKGRPRRNEPEHPPEKCTSEPADHHRSTAPAAAQPSPPPRRFGRSAARVASRRPPALSSSPLAAAPDLRPHPPDTPTPQHPPTLRRRATPTPTAAPHPLTTTDRPHPPNRNPNPPPPSALAMLGLPARRGTCSAIRRSTPRSLPPRQRRP